MKLWTLFLALAFGFSLRAEDIHAREVWQSGENIEFSGIARKDVFLSGSELNLNALFEGDLWALGLRSTFRGTAKDDVRLAAVEVLKIDGTIDGTLRAAAWAGNLVVSTNSVVRGEAMLIAGRHATINGRFEGDLLVQGATLSIAAEVLGNLTVSGTEINLLPGTRVHGDLIDRAAQPLTVPEGVQIDGAVLRDPSQKNEMENYLDRMRWIFLGIQFFTAFVVGLFLIRMLPRFTARSVEVAVQHRAPSSMVGFLGLIMMGLFGWLLLRTVVGSGVGILLLAVCGLLFYTGKIITAFALGALLLRCNRPCGFGRVAFGLFAGLLLLYAAFQLPFLGSAIYLLASAWGMGAMLLCIRHSQRLPRVDATCPVSPEPEPSVTP